MPAKSVKKSAQTRSQILIEAERLYSAGGFEAINLQTIARAVGVSKAALFYHFEGKQALYVALLEHLLERYAKLIAFHVTSDPSQLVKKRSGRMVNTRSGGTAPHSSSEAQLRALSWALSTQPMFDAFRFLRSEQHHLSLEQQGHLQHACKALLFDPIKRVFELALERGEIRKLNISTASDLFLGFCVLASSMRAMSFGALTAAGHREMFEMFWHGMARE